jgi:hypothetical protein
MSTPPDPPRLLDELRGEVLPAKDTYYTRAQLLTFVVWLLIFGGWVLTFKVAPTTELRIDGLPSVRLVSLMSALLVLLLWGR